MLLSGRSTSSYEYPSRAAAGLGSFWTHLRDMVEAPAAAAVGSIPFVGNRLQSGIFSNNSVMQVGANAAQQVAGQAQDVVNNQALMYEQEISDLKATALQAVANAKSATVGSINPMYLYIGGAAAVLIMVYAISGKKR